MLQTIGTYQGRLAIVRLYEKYLWYVYLYRDSIGQPQINMTF